MTYIVQGPKPTQPGTESTVRERRPLDGPSCFPRSDGLPARRTSRASTMDPASYALLSIRFGCTAA